MSLKTVDVTDARVTNSHRRTHSTESSASAALTDRADEDVASESDSVSSDTLSDVSKMDICGVGRTFNRAVGLEVDPCLRTGEPSLQPSIVQRGSHPASLGAQSHIPVRDCT